MNVSAKEAIEHYQNLIANNKVSEVLEELCDLDSKYSKYYKNTFIVKSGDWKDLEEQRLKGTKTEELVTSEKTKFKHDLLSLIDNLAGEWLDKNLTITAKYLISKPPSDSPIQSIRLPSIVSYTFFFIFLVWVLGQDVESKGLEEYATFLSSFQSVLIMAAMSLAIAYYYIMLLRIIKKQT